MDLRKQINIIKHKRWVWIVCLVIFVFGLWHLFTSIFGEEEKELRRQLRLTIKETFPEQAAEFSKTVGLFHYGDDAVDPNRKSVVLIHGLDDPGLVWQNLAPALNKEDVNLWLLEYPNDQPIVESARFFFDEIKRLPDEGIMHLSIVAHSMGGLVSREMLTSPDLNYAAAVEKRLVPGVDELIMVGTPNHGSQLARFRLFAEMRDHMTRLASGNANWLGAIFDGAGEAKIDLLPGSQFLADLNSRPLPQGVKMLIIAGVTTPWNESDIKHWSAELKQNVPADHRQSVEDLSRGLIDMTHEVGDGLVTVDSTRLAGVEQITVDGNHLTIIRNLTAGSDRIPPAVPIIIDRLTKD
jgi:pimeloyl-ACP methyl ester carboxylesterase